MCKNFIQIFIFLVAINNFYLPKSQFLSLTEFIFGFTSNVVFIICEVNFWNRALTLKVTVVNIVYTLNE